MAINDGNFRTRPFSRNQPPSEQPQLSFHEMRNIPPTQPGQVTDKLIVTSEQSAHDIITLATMLGLQLVYQEPTKLVFNRTQQGMQEMMFSQQPGYPRQPPINLVVNLIAATTVDNSVVNVIEQYQR